MANFGHAPYEEAAVQGTARVSMLQRIGQILSGAGQGIAAARGATNPLESAALSFSGAYGASQAARQAAEQYAMKKVEADRAEEERVLRMKNLESEIEARAKVKPEPPPKPSNTQVQYDELIRLGHSPKEARQLVYGLLPNEQTAREIAGRKPDKPNEPTARQQSRADKLDRETFALQGEENPTELIKVSNDGSLEPETRQRAWAKYRRLTTANNPSQVR